MRGKLLCELSEHLTMTSAGDDAGVVDDIWSIHLTTRFAMTDCRRVTPFVKDVRTGVMEKASTFH